MFLLTMQILFIPQNKKIRFRANKNKKNKDEGGKVLPLS